LKARSRGRLARVAEKARPDEDARERALAAVAARILRGERAPDGEVPPGLHITAEDVVQRLLGKAPIVAQRDDPENEGGISEGEREARRERRRRRAAESEPAEPEGTEPEQKPEPADTVERKVKGLEDRGLWDPGR
jgi:hypothetical protein